MDDKTKACFDVVIESVKWNTIRGLRPRLGRAAAMTISFLPKGLQRVAAEASWTVLLTTDRAVQTLNHDFRGLDKPTNVLSFPQEEPEALRRRKKGAEPLYVGDIAVAYQYVAKEAKAEEKILLDHVTHLVIHGILHLFGYDHMVADEAVKMERLETKIMAALGLADPYAQLEAPVASRAKKPSPTTKTSRAPRKASAPQKRRSA